MAIDLVQRGSASRVQCDAGRVQLSACMRSARSDAVGTGYEARPALLHQNPTSPSLPPSRAKQLIRDEEIRA